MNIWILNHYAITPDMTGGTRHYDLGSELVKRGVYAVTIVASSFNYNTRKEERLGVDQRFRIEIAGGVRFIWIKTFPYLKNNWRRVINWLSYSFRAIYIGIKIRQSPDVIIGSSVHLFAPLSGYIISRLRRCKFVFEVRDLWPQTLIDVSSISKNHPLIIFFRLLERFLYSKADKIITLLPKGGEYIKKFGVSEEKIIWIPNGVSDIYFRKKMKKKNNTSREFIIMYLGAHGQANGLSVIVDAAKILQTKKDAKIRFLLIGDGQEKGKLIRKAEIFGLRNIEFAEPVPKNCIPDIMNEADAFIFNLEDSKIFRYGISSNKLFEYMSAERPVIFSCNSYNNPINEANAGITVPPQNAEALADAAIRLYSLPANERVNMGRRGKQYVKRNHTINILADRLVTVLNEL